MEIKASYEDDPFVFSWSPGSAIPLQLPSALSCSSLPLLRSHWLYRLLDKSWFVLKGFSHLQAVNLKINVFSVSFAPPLRPTAQKIQVWCCQVQHLLQVINELVVIIFTWKSLKDLCSSIKGRKNVLCIGGLADWVQQSPAASLP